MTVIDVNTGKFTGQGGNLEETVTRNNLEAAEEIVRQLRLRDVGGIIVIDFIDMVLESNRELVLRRLLECLARDRTKHQVAEVTSLGLVQMTRKRVGAGLLEAFSVPCECCNGRGVHVSLDLADLGQPGQGSSRCRRAATATPHSRGGGRGGTRSRTATAAQHQRRHGSGGSGEAPRWQRRWHGGASAAVAGQGPRRQPPRSGQKVRSSTRWPTMADHGRPGGAGALETPTGDTVTADSGPQRHSRLRGRHPRLNASSRPLRTSPRPHQRSIPAAGRSPRASEVILDSSEVSAPSDVASAPSDVTVTFADAAASMSAGRDVARRTFAPLPPPSPSPADAPPGPGRAP